VGVGGALLLLALLVVILIRANSRPIWSGEGGV
jgi:hypothetical protein